jgi:hypothetical protein
MRIESFCVVWAVLVLAQAPLSHAFLAPATLPAPRACVQGAACTHRLGRGVDTAAPVAQRRGVQTPTPRRAPHCVVARASMAAGTGCGLGFDFGTSGARICVVDGGAAQEIVHEASVPYAEQSPDVWVSAMETLLDGIPAPVRARIISVAVSGTSSSVMLVDSSTGKVSRGPRMYDFAASKEAVALASSAAPGRNPPNSAFL